jgi:hypothetical protein
MTYFSAKTVKILQFSCKFALFSCVIFHNTANAVITLTALNSAIACNASMERRYWTTELTATYGAPIRTEGGALWFKGSGELYGAPIKEVFVAAKHGYQFVGAVLDTTPDKLVDPIQNSRSFPTNLFATPADGWVGANAMHLKWHKQKYAKVFCIGVGRYINSEK